MTMKTDLHIHTKTGSDGKLPLEDVFEEANNRNIEFISITDHDSIDCQEQAIELALEYGMAYVTGVELNVTLEYQSPETGIRTISLDFLGYGFDSKDRELNSKLLSVKEHREVRARQIMENLNAEFDKEGIPRFTEHDMRTIQRNVDGVFGRPHIANYLIQKQIVRDTQEAFEKYLVKCDVPKYPLFLEEAAKLIGHAGGKLVLAHPNDPHGTSLVSLSHDLDRQTRIIEEYILDCIDGVECWHSRNNTKTTEHYIEFAKKHSLIMTGGSDCHQNPILMGVLNIPDLVWKQFSSNTKGVISKIKGVLT
ncbi:MAG: PHP domain-containing protein [Chloroflexota bacterium]|nr:PHP domain-containing protein [Chloroflexota bacterium]